MKTKITCRLEYGQHLNEKRQGFLLLLFLSGFNAPELAPVGDGYDVEKMRSYILNQGASKKQMKLFSFPSIPDD